MPELRAWRAQDGPDTDGVGIVLEQAEALDVGGAESERFAEHSRLPCRVRQLQAEREITGEQPKTDGDPIGMQAIADEMIEVMAVDQFVKGLLDPPALTVEGSEALGTEPLDIGDVHPGAAGIGRGAGGQGQQVQVAGIPATEAEANGTDVLEPAALLAGKRGEARAQTGRPSKAEDKRNARLDEGGDGGPTGEAAIGHDAREAPLKYVADPARQHGGDAMVAGIAAEQDESDDLARGGVHGQIEAVATKQATIVA